MKKRRGNYSNVTKLHIHHMYDIDKLPYWIFLLPSLEKLIISETSICSIGNIFPISLTRLIINNNKITSLPDNLPQTLIDLNCNWNELTSLPDTLPQNLTYLDCSHNDLTSLPDTLPQNLTKLYCYENELTSLPDNLPQSLTFLDCSDNKLTSLPLSILRCHRLLEFSHYDNPIEYRSPQILRFLNRIQERRNARETREGSRVYSDTQSIHNSKIQESVYNSIINIMNTGTKEDRQAFRIEEVLGNELLEESVKQALLEYIADKTEHSLLYITFEELFIDVWNRIKKHKNSTEIKKILNQEMRDALCKCFTGRLTRLVNCLNGFFDDIIIHISNTDQIGNIILIAKEKLEILGEYTVEKHKEMVRKELIERDYKDETIEEWLSFIE